MWNHFQLRCQGCRTVSAPSAHLQSGIRNISPLTLEIETFSVCISFTVVAAGFTNAGEHWLLLAQHRLALTQGVLGGTASTAWQAGPELLQVYLGFLQGSAVCPEFLGASSLSLEQSELYL